MKKIKITIKPPRCKKCRERALKGDVKEIMRAIEEMVKVRFEKNLPIKISIQKLPKKKKSNPK